MENWKCPECGDEVMLQDNEKVIKCFHTGDVVPKNLGTTQNLKGGEAKDGTNI